MVHACGRRPNDITLLSTGENLSAAECLGKIFSWIELLYGFDSSVRQDLLTAGGEASCTFAKASLVRLM